jgi:hypothetical protein
MLLSTLTIMQHLKFLLILTLLTGSAAAQSSLFNIPTSDVLGEKETYIEADFDAKFAKYRNGGWQSYGFQAIYGVAKKAELGVNAYSVRTADGFEPVEIQPNFKYQIYNNESTGVSVATGAIAYVPFSGRFKKDTFGNVYAVASKSFKRNWTPRLSGGAYQLIGTKADTGSKNGFLLGVEQPLHKRVTFIVDWNTGKNRFGYSAAGLGITLTKNSYLYSAYYFGNEGRGNNSLGIYYGFSF